MFFVLLTLCVVLIIVLIYKYNNRNYWKKRNVVQVNEVLLKFVFGDKSLAEMFKKIYDMYPTEPYVGMYAGVKPSLLIRDLQNVQAVLASDFESFNSRGIVINDNDILGNNLLAINDYNKWKTIRQKISPIFTSAKLKNMSYIIERCARDFIEMLKERKDMRDKPFNAIYTYTTASIGASVFGIDTRIDNTMNSPFLDMAWKTITPTFASNMKFLICNMSVKLFRLLNLKPFGEHEGFFVGFVKNVLKSRRGSSLAIHDFIDLCIELQKAGAMRDPTTGFEIEPTDEVLAAQAFFFFIAGTDTSANTMHFTLLELSCNPNVLKKVHEEIDEVFTRTNGNINYESIEKLEYLDMVVSEAMRKYPPIGINQRVCTKDTVLPVGNLNIEKGVIINVPVYAIHRDEKYFPDPELFNPERFSPANVSQMPKFCYMPFGEGKRICLGARFARLQVKAGLSYLLRSFTLKEQNYRPKHFEKSFFAIRDPDATFELIQRI